MIGDLNYYEPHTVYAEKSQTVSIQKYDTKEAAMAAASKCPCMVIKEQGKEIYYVMPEGNDTFVISSKDSD